MEVPRVQDLVNESYLIELPLHRHRDLRAPCCPGEAPTQVGTRGAWGAPAHCGESQNTKLLSLHPLHPFLVEQVFLAGQFCKCGDFLDHSLQQGHFAVHVLAEILVVRIGGGHGINGGEDGLRRLLNARKHPLQGPHCQLRCRVVQQRTRSAHQQDHHRYQNESHVRLCPRWAAPIERGTDAARDHYHVEGLPGRLGEARQAAELVAPHQGRELAHANFVRTVGLAGVEASEVVDRRPESTSSIPTRVVRGAAAIG
mmetsp:Transcript_67512/g.170856  ORF Transcript_67512/g.170856 Transcript_67512/m.170856 type:complete len:256 (+) Transcript_67512:1171-1938(+)